MNRANFQQIVNHYIDCFEVINGSKHQEYYKWQIANDFRPMMDAALESSDSEFPAKLYQLKKRTRNVIDSYTQPFHGLCKFAEKEPQTVRQMLVELYASDDLSKQEKVTRFLEQSHALREKYYSGSYLYSDDMHSVTGYMFLYDPDDNYLYKASHARIFADCVEFYDDWGYGEHTRLDVFNHMCDEVIEAINDSPELLATAESRFEIDPAGMHPDQNKHILLFDIIYCCSTYQLFKGIHFVVPKNSERKLMQQRKETAKQLSAALREARAKLELLEEGQRVLDEAVSVGMQIHHRLFGDGIIQSIDATTMTVDFMKAGTKSLGIATAVLNGIVTTDDATLCERLTPYRECLMNAKQLGDAVSFAERKLAPYIDYLE